MLKFLDSGLSIFLKCSYGLFGLVSVFFGGVFIVTSVDLASNDVPDRSELKTVTGQICQVGPFGRGHTLIEMCETSESFILRRESGGPEAAATFLQPGEYITMLAEQNSDSHATIFEVDLPEAGWRRDLSTIRKSYRTDEIQKLIWGLAMMIGGVWMGWFLRRSVK